nr:hypothetical protein [Tanacetum cinerariifolium]
MPVHAIRFDKVIGYRIVFQRKSNWNITMHSHIQRHVLSEATSPIKKDDAKPPISADTFGSNGDNDSKTTCPKAPVKEVVDNGIESEVVVGLPTKFQEGDMVDALLRVEQKSSRNWKELDNEDRKVEMDTKRKGEPTILATFDSDRGITLGSRN